MSSNILLRLFLIKQKNFNNKKIAYLIKKTGQNERADGKINLLRGIH